MRKLALKVEHSYQNRVVGVHLLENSMATVGSVRGAHIRLLGDDVAGLHAAFDLQDDQWVLSDLGSKAGTHVAQMPIVELKLEGPTVIHIGAHQLKATPQRLERALFADPLIETEGAQTYHQVIVLRKGLLHASNLLKADEVFESEHFGRMGAPKNSDWVITEAGDFTLKQRLTKSDVILATREGHEDLRKSGSVMVALAALVLTLGAFVFRAADHTQTPTVDTQNQYTRMIFDGKKVRQKRLVAEKLQNQIQGSAAGGASKQVANNKPAASAKVVMNLKNAGLGALIGKVASRAGKTALLVQSAGVSADSGQASGRALGLGGGSALDKLGGGVGGTGTTMKVGGLGTVGKGGGGNGFKGTGALSQGNIGNAEVGVLEEESEIEGGLDKEAIARVIRSQLGQIRYCYERQLSASPDLYGKIMIKFTIGGAGAVVAQAVGTTSLNNAMVEGCILRRVAGWQFPTPKGGTNVLVTYPFLFKSTK